MKKKKRKFDEVNYWETMADSLIALLLCILLIALMLILYLVRIPEKTGEDELGDSTEQYSQMASASDDWDYDDDADDEKGDNWHDKDAYGGGNYGGGGGGGGTDAPGEKEFDDPYPGRGDSEGSGKAAVYVEIVDAETERTIKYENIEFELYDWETNQLQMLSTYYPDKIDFKKFLTDEVGTFFLPEKIPVQYYYFHALNRVPGYDYAEDTLVELDQGYDWKEPFTVKIYMGPEKNIIRVRLMDQNSGKTITGATFDVVAATDITTKDGTIRCKEGDIVDTIVLDVYGYGESKELYLGDYLLQQAQVPQYYAKLLEDTKVTVDSKAKATEVKVTELREEKTKAKIALADELYATVGLKGVGYSLQTLDGKQVRDGVTNDSGSLIFTDLMKDTTYVIHQTSALENYRNLVSDYEFTVNVNGLINGEALHLVDMRNRMIRVSIGVKDKLFRGQVSDVNIAVCDASGELIKTWSSTAIEQTLEGLEPGEYLVILAGNEKAANRITVTDTADLQNFQFSKWTTADIGALLALALFLIAFLVFLILYLIHRAKEKEEEKEEEQNKQTENNTQT